MSEQSERLRLVVAGAAGRMGRRIVALAQESGRFELVGALEAEGHGALGVDVGEIAGIGPVGVALSTTCADGAEVMIDFSPPAGAVEHAAYCACSRTPLVVGTTGLGEEEVAKVQEASHQVAVLLAPNMSVGINLLLRVVGDVARRLGEDYDVEIVESHHRFKRDAPSGTALALGKQIAEAREYAWPDCLTHGRAGVETTRQEQTIGMHAVRAGDIIGEHRVLLSALGETIELRHSAHSRDTFVRGALRAAEFIADQAPGWYSMADVLGL